MNFSKADEHPLTISVGSSAAARLLLALLAIASCYKLAMSSFRSGGQIVLQHFQEFRL